MKRCNHFLGLLFFFSASCLFGQNVVPMDDAGLFLNNLKETSLATHTIKADFTEEKTLSFLKEPQKSTGVFYYKKENRMRWEKTEPVPYIFLVNGDKVRIRENGKEKELSSFNEAIGKIKDMMIVLVNGEFQNDKTFSPLYFQNESVFLVRLIPKNKRLANIYESIQLIFSKQTLQLKELDFFEKSGDKSKMIFYNAVLNEVFDDKLFTDF